MRSRDVDMLVGLAVSLIALPCSSSGEGLRDDTIIAAVDGLVITYGDVKVRPNASVLLMRFREKHGRNPETEADREVMERERRARELGNLREQIRGTVRRQQIAKFGIDPTEEEIEARTKLWESEREAEGERIDRGAMAREWRDNLRQLLEALKEVIDEGQDADDVYRRRLAGKMSREGWRLRLQYVGTPKKRQQLERALTLSDDELLDLHDGFRQVLIREELDKAVDEELSRTDPEFAEYLRLVKTDPRNEKVRSKAPNYRAAKRQEWWRRRYREADIQIKDERFKDVLKELFR